MTRSLRMEKTTYTETVTCTKCLRSFRKLRKKSSIGRMVDTTCLYCRRQFEVIAGKPEKEPYV